MEQTSFAVLVCISLASLALVLGCHAAVWLAQRRRDETQHEPPLSVLKPLKGVYPGLYENLVSLASQDYPDFEIIFGCESPKDAARVVASRVAREFPHVPMIIVTGAPSVGFNPKVNNLRHMERRARHEVLLISDADVRAGKDYLRTIAAELSDPNVGLVCNAFSGLGDHSLGAALENLHLSGFVTSTICGSSLARGRPVVVGKSMLFRRKDLAAVGGWDAIANVLAEDFVFGELIERLGRRVALSSYVVPVVNGQRTIGEYWARHVRWGQMRRQIVPRLYWLEPLLFPSPWLCALLALDASSWQGAGYLTTFALAALGVRIASDAILVGRLRGEAMHPALLPLSVAKDFIAVAAWFVAAFRTTVEWRGNVFRIGAGSTLSPLEAAHGLGPVTANRA